MRWPNLLLLSAHRHFLCEQLQRKQQHCCYLLACAWSLASLLLAADCKLCTSSSRLRFSSSTDDRSSCAAFRHDLWTEQTINTAATSWHAPEAWLRNYSLQTASFAPVLVDCASPAVLTTDHLALRSDTTYGQNTNTRCLQWSLRFPFGYFHQSTWVSLIH